MSNNLYFYCAFSSMYDTLHGMYDGNIEEGTLDDMEINAHECSRQVIEGYDCIMQAIHDDVNETLGYDDTPPMTPTEIISMNWSRQSKKKLPMWYIA